MDTITAVAIVTHAISTIVAFFAAHYTYHYIRRSAKFFVVRERTPFFTLGLASFGVASIFDVISLFAGFGMELSLGALIRMLALIQMMYGSLVLLQSVHQPDKRPLSQQPPAPLPPEPSLPPKRPAPRRPARRPAP